MLIAINPTAQSPATATVYCSLCNPSHTLSRSRTGPQLFDGTPLKILGLADYLADMAARYPGTNGHDAFTAEALRFHIARYHMP